MITVITGRRGMGKSTVAHALVQQFRAFRQPANLIDDVDKASRSVLKQVRESEKGHVHTIVVSENPSVADELAEAGMVPSRVIAVSRF